MVRRVRRARRSTQCPPHQQPPAPALQRSRRQAAHPYLWWQVRTALRLPRRLKARKPPAARIRTQRPPAASPDRPRPRVGNPQSLRQMTRLRQRSPPRQIQSKSWRHRSLKFALAFPPACRGPCGRLQLEAHPIALIQRPDACRLERRCVNEDIFTAVVGLDEAKPLCRIEELHSTVHGCWPLVWDGGLLRASSAKVNDRTAPGAASAPTVNAPNPVFALGA